MDERVKELESGIKWIIEQIDYNLYNIDQDFKENQDGVCKTVGGTFLRGQAKVYRELRESLEQLLEGEQ